MQIKVAFWVSGCCAGEAQAAACVQRGQMLRPQCNSGSTPTGSDKCWLKLGQAAAATETAQVKARQEAREARPMKAATPLLVFSTAPTKLCKARPARWAGDEVLPGCVGARRLQAPEQTGWLSE